MTRYILTVFFASLLWVNSSYAATSLFTKEITESSDRVMSLPGLGHVDGLQLAGTLPITKSDNLFYWFVESHSHSDANTPIVLWLNGGPGAGSTYGFFMENGPYAVTKQGKLLKREHAWTAQTHYLIIDQPAGVGLSFGTKDIFANEAQAMDQLYQALNAFYQRYPELLANPLFIAGQSYAGKYIPELAIRILKGKNNINLKGILVGSGWVNPRLQQSTIADFAYSHGLIDSEGYKRVVAYYQNCAKEIDKSKPSSSHANQACKKMQSQIKKESGLNDLTNIRSNKEYDNTNMTQYLNRPDVRKALHVDPRPHQYKSFNEEVSSHFEVGLQDSVADLYVMLLRKNIRVLIYTGLNDGTDSNFIGATKWLEALQWPYRQQFIATPNCIWRVNSNVAGYAKNTSGLTQLKIRNAGHIAPADQPEILVTMLNQFVSQKKFCK